MFGGPPKYFPTQSGGGALIFLISQGGGESYKPTRLCKSSRLYSLDSRHGEGALHLFM